MLQDCQRQCMTLRTSGRILGVTAQQSDHTTVSLTCHTTSTTMTECNYPTFLPRMKFLMWIWITVFTRTQAPPFHCQNSSKLEYVAYAWGFFFIKMHG